MIQRLADNGPIAVNNKARSVTPAPTPYAAIQEPEFHQTLYKLDSTHLRVNKFIRDWIGLCLHEERHWEDPHSSKAFKVNLTVI